MRQCMADDGWRPLDPSKATKWSVWVLPLRIFKIIQNCNMYLSQTGKVYLSPILSFMTLFKFHHQEVKIKSRLFPTWTLGWVISISFFFYPTPKNLCPLYYNKLQFSLIFFAELARSMHSLQRGDLWWVEWNSCPPYLDWATHKTPSDINCPKTGSV